MIVRNATTGTLISDDAKGCRSIFSKGIGLMFRRRVKRPLVMIFSKEQKISLHMWFVFCPIDVIYLDRKKRVIETVENFRPFRYHISRRQAQFIIEMEHGTIKRHAIRIGDVIELK